MRVGLIKIYGGRSCRPSEIAAFIEVPSMSYDEKLGDWFLLQLICKNLNILSVNKLIKNINKSEEVSNSNETLEVQVDHKTTHV